MLAETTHPLIQHSIVALDRPDLRARALTERGGAAAAVIDDRTHRWIVIGHESEGWATPALLSATRRPPPSPQPLTTPDREPLRWRSTAQVGPARPLSHPNQRPDVAWCAVAGITAKDTVRIVATTSIDRHEAEADDSGLVLLLVRSPWAFQPHLDVHLADGRTVPIRYH